MINLFRNWVEFLFVVVLIIGFGISISLESLGVTYFVIFLCGMVVGRMWYQGKKAIKLPTMLVIVGFVVGYIFGTRYGGWKGILFFFVLGALIAYYIYEKKYLKI